MGKLTFKGGIHPYEGKERKESSDREVSPKRRHGLPDVSAHRSTVCSVCQKG